VILNRFDLLAASTACGPSAKNSFADFLPLEV